MKSNGKKIVVSLIIALLLGTSIGHAQGNGNIYYARYNNRVIGGGTPIYYGSYLRDWFSNTGFNFIPVQPSYPTQQPRPNNPEPSNPAPSNPAPNNPTPSNPAPSNPTTGSAIEQEVLRLVNIERQKAGLAHFTHSAELSRVARIKSEDMARNNYFSHNSPTYGDPFAMIRSFGVQYRTAGENIAKGYSSAQSVVNGWMNSSGHRANILNPAFGKIGIGYANINGTSYWTQMFTD